MEEDTVPPEKSTDGITRSAWSLDRLKDTLKKRLKLPEKFVVLDWQAVLIERILEGYDTIAVAGTGRGKSLIWEGFAAMKPKKTVVVIEPLKSVEEDMVRLVSMLMLVKSEKD
jgi:superfamily II DNA helicase RecQ